MNPTSETFKWIEKKGIQLEREYRQKGSDGEPKEKDNKGKSLLGSCEPKKNV